jgi:hypothetical protein
MRKSITLGGNCSEDSVCSIVIEDNEDRRRLRGPRIFLKAFIREIDGDSTAFELNGEFVLALLLPILSRDFFLNDRSRKVLA